MPRMLGEWFLRLDEDGGAHLYRYASEEPELDRAALESRELERLRSLRGALADWALHTELEFSSSAREAARSRAQ